VADRTSDAAADAAFNDLAEALRCYLEAKDWKALVVGRPRIQQQPGAREFDYEFVVEFTGGKRRGAPGDGGASGGQRNDRVVRTPDDDEGGSQR